MKVCGQSAVVQSRVRKRGGGNGAPTYSIPAGAARSDQTRVTQTAQIQKMGGLHVAAEVHTDSRNTKIRSRLFWEKYGLR